MQVAGVPLCAQPVPVRDGGFKQVGLMNEAERRFFDKIIFGKGPDDCWVFGRRRKGYKYGVFYPSLGDDRKQVGAHRWAYEWFYGVQIKHGLFIDHICRNKPGVRPDHLRLVTPRQNAIENSISPPAYNIKKLYCKKGHLFSVANTYVYTKGNRSCRICKRAYQLTDEHRKYHREYMRRWNKKRKAKL